VRTTQEDVESLIETYRELAASKRLEYTHV
jgi:hypothetical protein